MPRRLPGVTRLVCHLAAWASVVVPTVSQLARGWRPFGDDAAIASRAYQVFSLHPPLLGLASAVSYRTGHSVFDPGPLLFYLLSVPVHIDPNRGLLWGAALWSGLALSVAVEAAWSVGRWVGGILVAFVVLDLFWLTPGVFGNLAWNAYFPVPFLIAAFAAAMATCVGSARWWPVVVVAASVAAESHLFFVVPSVALVVVALVFGAIRSWGPRRFGWLVTGLVLAALCWLAPIIEQLTAIHGNLTGLLVSGKGQASLGVSFALRDVGLAAALHPVWLTHQPSGFFPTAALETAYPAWYGALVLGLLGVVAAVALLAKHRVLGSMGLLTLVTTAGLTVNLAVFPAKNALSIGYLIDVFWIVGILLWVLVIAVFGTTVGLVAAHIGAASTGPGGVQRLVPQGALLGLAALVVVGVLGIGRGVTRPVTVSWNSAEVTLDSRLATTIETQVPPEAVSILVLDDNFFTGTWVTEGVAYRLESDGWTVGTSGDALIYTGLAIQDARHEPNYVIRLHGTTLVSLQRS